MSSPSVAFERNKNAKINANSLLSPLSIWVGRSGRVSGSEGFSMARRCSWNLYGWMRIFMRFWAPVSRLQIFQLTEVFELLPQPDGSTSSLATFPKTNGKYCVVKFSLRARRGRAIAEQFPLERENNLQANARNRIKFIKRNLSQSLMCSAKPRKHSFESNSNLRRDEFSCQESKAKPSVGGKSLIIVPQIRFSFTYLRKRDAQRAVHRWGSLASLNFRLCDRSSTRNPPAHLARIMHAHMKRVLFVILLMKALGQREVVNGGVKSALITFPRSGIRTCFEVLKLLRLHTISMNNKFSCFHALSVLPDQASHWTFAENIHLLINLKNLFAFYWFEERRKKREKQNEQSFLARFTTTMEEKFGFASGWLSGWRRDLKASSVIIKFFLRFVKGKSFVGSRKLCFCLAFTLKVSWIKHSKFPSKIRAFRIWV